VALQNSVKSTESVIILPINAKSSANNGINTRLPLQTNNNNKQQPSNQTKYATRSTTQKKKQNNALTYTNKDYSSDVETEINHIEEIFELQEPSLGNSNIGTEVLIQGIATNGQHLLLLGLLDAGATGSFIKQLALKNIMHSTQVINLQVKGQYSQSHIKHLATFEIKLPDFYSQCTVKVQAYMEDKVVGQHDLVFGI
jgi:hypothetical protein